MSPSTWAATLRHSASTRLSRSAWAANSACTTAAMSSWKPSSSAASRPCLPPKWAYTDPEVRSAASATASTDTAS